MATLTCLRSVGTNLTLTCPFPKSFVCNLPDSGRHVTSVYQGLCLCRSMGRVGENPGNEVAVLSGFELYPRWVPLFVYCRIEYELDRSNRHAVVLQIWPNIIQSSVGMNVAPRVRCLESQAFRTRHKVLREQRDQPYLFISLACVSSETHNRPGGGIWVCAHGV